MRMKSTGIIFNPTFPVIQVIVSLTIVHQFEKASEFYNYRKFHIRHSFLWILKKDIVWFTE